MAVAKKEKKEWTKNNILKTFERVDRIVSKFKDWRERKDGWQKAS